MNTNPPWADKKLTKEQRADMAFRYQDWLLTKNVPSGGFRLLYAITQCLNEENQFHCFPSIDYLAALIKRTPSTVWSMLPKLEEIGAIEIEWGSQGSRHPNTYRLPAGFLEFYFGPDKGRLPKPILVPKKHRQAGAGKPRQIGVSKPRQTGVSSASETPMDGEKNPDTAPKKPRHIGESHLLATYSHKSAPPARSSARVERGDVTETETTVADAPLNPAKSTSQDAPVPEPETPVARAIARTDASENQPSPSRVNPIGAAANGRGEPATNPRQAGFERVIAEWPPDRIVAEGKAFFACCRATDALGDIDLVVDAIITLKLERGADLPDLADALAMIIERNLAATTNEPGYDDD